MKGWWAAAIAALAALAVGIGVAEGSGSSSPKIAFVTRAAGSPTTVWVANADGTDRRRLGPGSLPQVAPDGSLVAAATPAGLVLYPASGGAPHGYFDTPDATAVPVAFSPDSRYLAVVLTSRNPASVAASGLAVLDTATMSGKLIARGQIYGASFAQDGSDRIAYASAPSSALTARVDIHVIAATGASGVRVTNDGRSLNPVWGPSRIAFDRERLRRDAEPAYQVWTMASDGSGRRAVTSPPVPRLRDGLVPIAFTRSVTGLLAEYVGQDTSQTWLVTVATGRAARLGSDLSGAALARSGAIALIDRSALPSSPVESLREGTRAPQHGQRQPAWGSLGHGSWSWFGDPRAVYVSGQYQRIYVGWIGWSGQVTIGAYDPQFGVTRTRVIGHEFHDDHSDPSIFVEPDKRLTAFWSGHDGSTMFYRSTLRPEDISAWGPLQRVPGNVRGELGFTYPNPVLLPDEGNKLYLFWRGGNWSADYATRALDGRWSKVHELIRVPGERPYVKVDSDGRDKIAFAFTNGHPRNVLTSIYYVAYQHGALWTAGGRHIARMPGPPIAPRQADVVYDAKATHIPAWVWDVALDRRGRPVIVYATVPRNEHDKYWYATWTGTRWVSHFLANAGGTISPGTIEYEYSGGITLDHSDPSIVYLSRQVRGGFDVERWTTRDSGARWRHSVVVPADGTDNVRPVVPRGWDRGPMRLLWLHGHYGSYTKYRTSVDYVR